MEVMVDNVWATPSTLHLRVTVWGPDRKWRHRYDAVVPTNDIPEEAVLPWLRSLGAAPWNDRREQLPLF